MNRWRDTKIQGMFDYYYDYYLWWKENIPTFGSLFFALFCFARYTVWQRSIMIIPRLTVAVVILRYHRPVVPLDPTSMDNPRSIPRQQLPREVVSPAAALPPMRTIPLKTPTEILPPMSRKNLLIFLHPLENWVSSLIHPTMELLSFMPSRILP